MNYKTKIKSVSWNVRGLNEKDKRIAVRETVFFEKPDIVCFQETKLSVIDDVMRKEICGRRLNKYVTLPARGTRGGIMIAWQEKRFHKISETRSEYCLTVNLKDALLDKSIVYTGVYGPNNSAMRRNFFHELEEMKPNDDTPWIIAGDFNTTLEMQDGNSTNQDMRWPIEFQNCLSELGLQDIRMEGRTYTWSNTREQPAMAKLDRFLISVAWSTAFPNSKQQTLPNTNSDHCPIRFEAMTDFKKSKIFRFEKFWLKIPDFKEFVIQEWQGMQLAENTTQLHQKLIKLQKRITQWTTKRVGNIKRQIIVCREFIGWVEEAQEVR